MSSWQGDMAKREQSGGRRIAHRKKRKFEQGTFPVETKMGEQKGSSSEAEAEPSR